MNKELRAKSNEELAALVVRLKMQLLESRFRMASGELEKLHAIKEIRRTIARALTILNERSVDLSIGTHGVTMYNLKTKEVKSITNDVEKFLTASNNNKPTEDKKTSSTKKVEKTNNTKVVTAKTANSSSVNTKAKTTTKKTINKPVIRKTSGK